MIRNLRKQKSYTILQLATDLNIDTTYLGQIERGEKIPSIDVAVNIINYFNITFINREDSKFNGIEIEKEIYDKLRLISSSDDYKFLYKSLLKFISFGRSDESV